MVSVVVGADSSAVLQRAKHVLFVEGTPEGLDVNVLSALLDATVKVQPLGPSISVESVATALHPHNPNYLFLIDRDDKDDDRVEASWSSFPDKEEHNLLIWRRKEIESYFLEPKWVASSQHLRPAATEDGIRDWIVAQAHESRLLAVANRVLSRLRTRVKSTKVELFKPTAIPEVAKKTDLVGAIHDSSFVRNLHSSSQECFSMNMITSLVDEEWSLLYATEDSPKWGVGRWRDLMPAKAIFNAMVSRWIQVKQADGAVVQGRTAANEFVKGLLRKRAPEMPTDLGVLKSLVATIVART